MMSKTKAVLRRAVQRLMSSSIRVLIVVSFNVNTCAGIHWVNTKPQRGDTLFSVTGSIGVAVFVDFEREFCFQRHISLVRPGPKLVAKYLHLLLVSPLVSRQALQSATGIAQKTVSLSSLRGFLIPLPPLEVQRQIVAEIEGYQSTIEEHKRAIAALEDQIKSSIEKVWGS